MTIYVTKETPEDEDWTFDWTPKGASVSDPIASAPTPASPSPDLVIHTPSHAATTTTLWFSGGVPGMSYPILMEAITTGGRTYSELLVFTIPQ